MEDEVCWVSAKELHEMGRSDKVTANKDNCTVALIRVNALMYAVRTNNKERLDASIESGVDVNFQNQLGRTALYYAAMELYDDDQAIIKTLIKAGSNINLTDKEGRTALHYAVLKNNPNSTRVLIQAVADVNVADNKGKTALHLAALQNKKLVASLLIKAGALIDVIDGEGKTALHLAVSKNNKHVIDKLIESGVDVNIPDNEGKTALYCAVEYYSGENLVHTLIQAGANVNVCDHKGKTILHCLAERVKSQDLVRTLLRAGAEVNLTDIKGKTAVHYAVEKDIEVDISNEENNSVLSALLESRSADVNIIDNDCYSPLFYAVISDNSRLVKTLIEAGADVDVCDGYGRNPLFHAVVNPNIVQLLLDHCGSAVALNKADIYGRTPLFYAIRESFASARILLDVGQANLHAQDNCNVSILAFFLEHYLFGNFSLSSDYMLQGLALFREKEVSKKVIFKALVDIVFCKTLQHLSPMYDMGAISEALTLAKEHFLKRFDFAKHQAIDKVLKLLKNTYVMEDESSLVSLAYSVLDGLVELGANPNSSDADGNTALHYATRLLFYGISKATVIFLCQHLKNLGLSVKNKNHQYETPLLYCLSREVWKSSKEKHQWRAFETLTHVCLFLLKHGGGSSIEDISRNGESVFHLVFEIFQMGFHLQEKDEQEKAISETTALLRLFVNANIIKGVTVNKRDVHLYSPLHLWASLELIPPEDPFGYPEDDTFNNFEMILQQLLECGAQLNSRNENEETPLHLCRTWRAVQLLIDAGARPNDTDSWGRPPLLSAAAKTISNKWRFYPDVSLDPKAFWKKALEIGLDPWAVDQHGDSVLGFLIKSHSFVLSKALINVAFETKAIQCDTIAQALLNAICKDESPRSYWKIDLAHKILESREISGNFNVDLSLYFCCRNIISTSRNLAGVDWNDVNMKLAQRLLLYGADYKVPNASGKSCLDIAATRPALRAFLEKKTLNIYELPFAIPWTSVSKTHRRKLEKVARKTNSWYIQSYWYYKKPLQSGSFGIIFAGINEKDGREVAIKRIEKLRMQRPEDKREITSLTALAESEKIVRYLHFFEDETFSYVVLELMEGNLDEYLDTSIDVTVSVRLCADVVLGVKHLHGQNILHRDIKPTNILYRVYPRLCLKIADFGLSRRIDKNYFSTVLSTNAVGTKCWIAPEVLTSRSDHSKSSDIFACGLVLHYLLSPKRHPFAPADSTGKSASQIDNETENNIMNNKMLAWDESISREMTNILKATLESDETRRPAAEEVAAHPSFWPQRKKIDLLIAVGNQKPEFTCPRAKRSTPLSAVETDLESCFGIIVNYRTWDDSNYLHMPALYAEMIKGRVRGYDTSSVVELVRFIRNSYAHVSLHLSKLLLEDYVFLDYFPNLVLEVFKAVERHGWHCKRNDISNALKD